MNRRPLRAAGAALAALAALAAGCSVDTATAPAPPRGPAAAPRYNYASTSPVYRNHLEFGTPVDASSANDLQLRKAEYATSHNCAEGVPNWVSWNLNRTHYGPAERSPSFYSDAALPAGCYRVTSSDYTGSGYSRGHMTRSEERTTSDAANRATFLMTNVVPQLQDLNGGPWYKFERWLEDQAHVAGREVYVISGPRGNAGTLNGAGRVVVPTHTWKVAVLMPYGQGLANVASSSSLQVVAVMMPNQAGIAAEGWERYKTTVDNIEYYTKYNLLDRLPDAVESYWEARTY
jgi:endonuclease G